MPSFTRKRLRFTFALHDAVFPGTTSSTLVLEGLRATVNLVTAGKIYGQCSVQIFGMRQEDMNLFPFVGPRNNARAISLASLLVESNDGDGWLAAFTGQIVTAGPDYSAMPDVALLAEARSVYFGAINPAVPSSYPGTVDVATIASNIAAGLQMRFENNGVTAQLTDPYLPNTLGAQLTLLADQTNVDIYVDPVDDVVVLCNRLQPRQGRAVLLSPASGMIGYPTMDVTGPTMQTYYNPAIRIGGKVQIDSAFSVANGEWTVFTISSSLSSEMPNGPWQSSVVCNRIPVSS